MTHTKLTCIRFLTLSALVALAPHLRAGDVLAVSWNDVCRETNGHELTIKTASGDTITGYCVAIRVDTMAVKTGGNKIVEIARAALSRIDMAASTNNGHQLKKLGQTIHSGLHHGFALLFSPEAPAGLVAVPATLVAGAIATPFCLLADLAADDRKKEVQIL